MRVLLLMASMLMIGWQPSPTPIAAQSAVEPAVEQISYTKVAGCPVVYVANYPPLCPFPILVDAGDGSHVIPVPDGEFLTWSPDGRRLLVVRGSDIYAAPATGVPLINLTNSQHGNVWKPAWSPDGTSIAFASDREGSPAIYVMKADGSVMARLPTGVGVFSAPAWSPDSTRLAFNCRIGPVPDPWWTTTTASDICMIHSDGSGFVRLTTEGGDDASPAWSPDGQRILFTSARYGGQELATMKPDGSEVVRLTYGGFSSSPVWSPDGQRILFTTGLSGAQDVAVINSDGSNLLQLTTGYVTYSATWSSDGSRIAFVSEIPPDDGPGPWTFIQAMNADGSNATDWWGGHSPAWRPWAGGLNDRPVAAFTFTCDALTCAFDASSSSDSDGRATDYAWLFSDGTVAAGRTATHSFAAGHDYSVQLVVMDDQGALTTTRQPVRLNQHPVVSFTATCNGLTCNFDGSATFDPDGRIEALWWSFDDGRSGFGAVTSHTFACGGTHTVRLSAGDSGAAIVTQTQTITLDVPIVPPVASFTFACNELTCNFDASGSSDPDGSITSYTWNFGDNDWATGLLATHTYRASGMYSVKLHVYDGCAKDSVARNVVAVRSMHVGDLDDTSTVQQSLWTPSVTITVHDGRHAAVANASVSGYWHDGLPASCTTNGNGQCAVVRSGLPRQTTKVSFSISGVSEGSSPYVPAENHDFDNDSDGTSISIRRH